MNKIFIDCGTHCFEGFEQFVDKLSIDSTWKCYCFEANPHTFELSQSKYTELINRGFNIVHKLNAVSISNCLLKINCASAGNEGYTNQGSNILKHPPSIDKVYGGIFDYDSAETMVHAINFTEFLQQNVTNSDYVVLKMDIEGSEFEVLENIICTGSFNLINECYVEFHERFFDEINFYKLKKDSIVNAFLLSGIKFEEWY